MKNLPKAKGRAKGGEPLVKVELLDANPIPNPNPNPNSNPNPNPNPDPSPNHNPNPNPNPTLLPLTKVELLEGGQVVREVSTAPLKEAKEASPQWPDQLQLLLGAGTVRPPQLHF